MKYYETERKFLVIGAFRHLAIAKRHIRQAFLNADPARSVRIRIQDHEAWLTIKGPLLEDGQSRFEWEKALSPEEGQQLLSLCQPDLIEKFRYIVPYGNEVIEVDEFQGENKGLILAEIEQAPQKNDLMLPDWLGREVTGVERYYNVQLAAYPYSHWAQEEKQ